MSDGEPLDFLHENSDDDREDLIAGLDGPARDEWRYYWPFHARAAQLAPPGAWRAWLVLAGRGFGKTRCGAEWVRTVAEADPGARIALVAASLHEARSVMVEGESGLLSVGAPWRGPRFEPSLRRLVWPNGAVAMLYSAGEPESLRGPQHSHAFRTGPEGGDRQRGAHLRGLVASSYGLGRARRSPRNHERRGNLARRRRCDGKLVGPRRNAGRMVGGWLAIRRPTARTARL